MRHSRAVFSTTMFVVLLPLTPAAAGAQAVSGELTGTVSAEGRPAVDVEVTAAGASVAGARVVITDALGRFRVVALPVGDYTLRLTRLGYRELVIDGVPVRLGRTTALGSLVLEAAALDLPPVRVRARASLLDPRSTEVGGVVEANEFARLPVERDHRFIAVLVPGADLSYYGDDLNIGGATGMENRYFVDGVDVSDPFRGASGMRLPHNFIAALQVRLGGYQAEHEGGLGGVIDVVTRSGGDRWGGHAFGYFAGSRFAAEPRRGATEPDGNRFEQFDGGIGVGGPLVANRLTFFGAYNPIVEREDVLVPGLGYFRDASVRHVVAGKLDWRASAAHQVTFTAVGDPSEREAVGVSLYSAGAVARAVENPDPMLSIQEDGGLALSLAGRHTLGPNLLLETTLSRFRHTTTSRPAGRGAPDEPLVRDNITGTWSGGFLEHVDERSTRWSVGARVSWVPRDHTVKLGAGYHDNHLDSDTYYDFLIIQPAGGAFQGHLERPGAVRNRVPWAFGQDSWQVHDRLLLNLGLRWQGEWLVGGDGRVAQSFPDELQPRLGFVLTPGADVHRLAGSWGRVYQQLSTYVTQRHFSGFGTEQRILHDGDPRLGPTTADTTSIPSTQPAADLRGQYEDVLAVEYQRQIGEHVVVGVQGIQRYLGDALENGQVAAAGGEIILGNPGRGLLDEYPRPWRRYRALVLSVARQSAERLMLRASYSLSRNEGNHPGIFHALGKWPWPLNGHYDAPHIFENAEGPLPNDRPHVFKLAGAYRTGFGLDAGLFFTWQSGTPLSEICCALFAFLEPRGSAGRTPALADLDLRLAYDLAALHPLPGRPRLLLDLFNIGSGGTVVDLDQRRLLGQHPDATNLRENPFWLSPIRFHPPFSLRVGMEAEF